MKLPFSIPSVQKEKPQYFLSLILKNERAVSVIFEKIGDSVKFVSSAEEDFKNTIEDAQTEEFLEVLDKSITKAEGSLPESIETHKTLFGLKENWIEENKIKKEYLEKLKKAASELSLDPIGFLETTESVVNLIQKEDGAPLTAVIADVGNKFVTVSLIKAGKITETKESPIHESAAFTVDTLLKHFQTPEVMPSKIIVISDFEKNLKQQFIGHKWSKSLPFLHVPQILEMASDANVKAMLLGAATQMGVGLLYSSPKMFEDTDDVEMSKEEVKDEETVTESAEPEKTDGKNEDILNLGNKDYVDSDTSLEYFGFVKGEDIAKNKPQIPELDNAKVPDRTLEQAIDETITEEKVIEEQKTPLPANMSAVSLKAKKFLASFIGFLKTVKINKLILYVRSSNNKKLLIIPAILGVLLIIALYFYLFATSATINITVTPKVEEKTAAVTFASESDIPNLTIASDTLTVSEEGSVNTKTTGKKDTGTKSKGKVTVFNNSDSSISLSSGTKITSSSNNLVFTFDSSVSVASASGDIFSGTTPGTSTVNVTASDIGQEYNLPSGSKFSFSGNSEVAAKNDDAFSGGTKKAVTIVSKDDEQKLLSDLPKNLEQKAKSDLKSKIDSDKSALPNFISEDVSQKDFDKNVGDESSSLTLKGKVDFSTVTYKNSDMLELASSVFGISKEQLENGTLNVNAKNIGSDEKKVNADLNIKAGILPKIDKGDLKNQIKGASKQKAQNIILNIEQVRSVDIQIKPSIPFLPKNLPSNTNKIIINITSNQ